MNIKCYVYGVYFKILRSRKTIIRTENGTFSVDIYVFYFIQFLPSAAIYGQKTELCSPARRLLVQRGKRQCSLDPRDVKVVLILRAGGVWGGNHRR